MKLTRKYKHLFELDILRTYCKLDHAENIKFKDCPFLYFLKKNDYFKDTNKYEVISDIIKKYEEKDGLGLRYKIDFEYDLLKIYLKYVRKYKSHPCVNKRINSVNKRINTKNITQFSIASAPFLHELEKNGYFRNGRCDLSYILIDSLIHFYEDSRNMFLIEGDSIFEDDETNNIYQKVTYEYKKEFKDLDFWEIIFLQFDDENIRICEIVQNDSHTACKVSYSVIGGKAYNFYFASNLCARYVIETFYQSILDKTNDLIEEKRKQIAKYNNVSKVIETKLKEVRNL